MNDSSRSIKACAQYYGENAAAVETYLLEGERRALELGNRGPILFDITCPVPDMVKAASVLL